VVTGVTVQSRADGVRFTVRVQPRASRTELAGSHDGALKVRLQAPPVDGAANEALVTLVAASLGVPRRDVHIVSGASARTKVVDVAGVGIEDVQRLANLR
jgi:uncharacterized protein (TIGR00251 family)